MRSEEERRAAGRQKLLIKDVRLFINSIDHAVSTVRQSGIKIVSEKEESESEIVYVLKVPKLRQAR